ncbi:hypothetical protein B0H13DRAFT_1867131 [Mycena leptocephala]|nr:hypothetical protein B0H13DRAFT_1867131 [Mycena leptocephala]
MVGNNLSNGGISKQVLGKRKRKGFPIQRLSGAGNVDRAHTCVRSGYVCTAEVETTKGHVSAVRFHEWLQEMQAVASKRSDTTDVEVYRERREHAPHLKMGKKQRYAPKEHLKPYDRYFTVISPLGHEFCLLKTHVEVNLGCSDSKMDRWLCGSGFERKLWLGAAAFAEETKITCFAANEKMGGEVQMRIKFASMQGHVSAVMSYEQLQEIHVLDVRRTKMFVDRREFTSRQGVPYMDNGA